MIFTKGYMNYLMRVIFMRPCFYNYICKTYKKNIFLKMQVIVVPFEKHLLVICIVGVGEVPPNHLDLNYNGEVFFGFVSR